MASKVRRKVTLLVAVLIMMLRTAVAQTIYQGGQQWFGQTGYNINPSQYYQYNTNYGGQYGQQQQQYPGYSPINYGQVPGSNMNYNNNNWGTRPNFKPVSMPKVGKWIKPNEDHLPKTTHPVRTLKGDITGRRVYLYDGPDIRFDDRPGTPSRPSAQLLRNVSAYLGIPYALPPTGDKRFRPPEPHPGVNSYSATEFSRPCPQPLMYPDAGYQLFSEDCLYLNIFSPGEISSSGSVLPVMIYIHGGEFEYGSGKLFPGHMLAASQQVIVVTFNYRLGPLGFFSTGDDASPGNYGMLDQVMAVKWVFENIGSFRGDQTKITLFGPGAGAASAGMLMASPLTRDIVTHVIAQSGSALADWAVITDLERARNTSRIFADRVGCRSDNSWKLVECLRARSFNDLCNQNIKPEVGYFPWAPVVDGSFTSLTDEYRFLPESPRSLIINRLFNPHRTYVGSVTRDEAAYILMKDSALSNLNFEVTPEYFNRKVSEYVRQYNYTLNHDGVVQAITYMYTYWADPNNNKRIREEYINMLSDAFFKSPNDEMLKLLLRKGVTTYMYVMNTTVEAFWLQDWQSVSHDTEFYFLSGAPYMDPEFFPSEMGSLMAPNSWTEGDRHMSAIFMKMFANIAIFGQPAPIQVPLTNINIKWEKMLRTNTEQILRYLNVNTTLNSTMEQDYRQRECGFWSHYIRFLLGPPPTSTLSPYEREIELKVGLYSSISAAILFMLLLTVTCCLYCRATSRAQDSSEYSESIVQDDTLSNNHIELTNGNNKNNGKYETQHTTV